MEEELNENELEERLYAMLHHVDNTKENRKDTTETIRYAENTTKTSWRRYWHTSSEQTNPYQKTNAPKDPITAASYKNQTTNHLSNTKPKEEKCDPPPPVASVDLSILQSPVPQNVKTTIEILEHDEEKPLELESSDEDEVVEVALPPKQPITIESSDEDELYIVNPDSPKKDGTKTTENKASGNGERDVISSPVPSVVSSVSDEFIHSDCIALKISSRHPDDHSFDFSLHGNDLIDQSTPAKKKKRKRNKDTVTSTPVVTATPDTPVKNFADECFATPKSKARNKKQKTKSYSVSEKSVPNPDIYDSDSNHSSIDTHKYINPYSVTTKSQPSADVYESDSNPSDTTKDVSKPKQNNRTENSESISSPLVNLQTDTPKSIHKDFTYINETLDTVDLTEGESFVMLDDTGLSEDIVLGISNPDKYYEDSTPTHDTCKYGSTKVPAILNEDLDFDNLKGKDKVCKRRRYSLTTLRAEMEKFYNESWGGEDFNHREIQKNMSRDKSLWMIDPKDRMPSTNKRKITCNYCNRVGHRDDSCRQRPPVCYMCGSTGHYEPRCPSKICVNCGSSNYMYSTRCRNCCSWDHVKCAECGQNGHPSSHCPDLWRRYHNTIDENAPLEKCRQMKKYNNLYCSGCTRRGHLIHTCRLTLPFSSLPINSPYVTIYRSIYFPNNSTECSANIQNNQRKQFQNKSNSISQDCTISTATVCKADRNKRQSKSPINHETHVNKKKITNVDVENRRNTRSPVNSSPQRKISESKEVDDKNKTKNANVDTVAAPVDKAPDFIPLSSSNHDKKGHMIQDNEVSDTSDVVTSARIYVTNDIIEKLKTADGNEWLKDTMNKCNVIIENTDINSFLSIKGKFGDQEAFQTELRDWTKNISDKENITSKANDVQRDNKNDSSNLNNIPKNRNNLLRQLNKALDRLKEDLGDPKALYKELTFLQNRHKELLKDKVINPQRLTNSSGHINEMLKKLNMVLLGQAGLADGSQHLHELYSFQEKLTNSRQKNIPPELRKVIGQHYHSIFTAIPRDDYTELLNKYYGSNQTTAQFTKKKKNKPFKISAMLNKPKNTIPSPPKAGVIEAKGIEKNNETRGGWIKTKLVFFHKRLLGSRPAGAILKKTRNELIKKLRTHISCLHKSENVSSKAIKKMKVVQKQAQMFLANV